MAWTSKVTRRAGAKVAQGLPGLQLRVRPLVGSALTGAWAHELEPPRCRRPRQVAGRADADQSGLAQVRACRSSLLLPTELCSACRTSCTEDQNSPVTHGDRREWQGSGGKGGG